MVLLTLSPNPFIPPFTHPQLFDIGHHCIITGYLTPHRKFQLKLTYCKHYRNNYGTLVASFLLLLDLHALNLQFAGVAMIKNYIIVAIRNLLRQKLYTFIHIFGLALGIACCLLMALFVKHEWSFDQFHINKNLLFRVVTQEVKPNGEIKQSTLFPHTIVETLKDVLPRASAYMRTEGSFDYGDQEYGALIGLVSPGFLTLFTFPLLTGDSATALDRPNAMVISETLALKIFGDDPSDYSHVLGQTLTSGGLAFEITGVAVDVPDVSSLRFDVLTSADHHRHFGGNYSDGGYASIYVQLAGREIPGGMDASLKSFAHTHLSTRIQNLIEWNVIPDEQAFTLTLQPLMDVYWNAQIPNSYEASGNLDAVYILWGLAGLVLLIACSNFTTLSIASSGDRALEVGLRKVLGGARHQLMTQFWSEALLLSLLGVLLGVALAEMFLPIFNGLIQRDLNITYFGYGSIFLILLIIVIAVGLLAGSYPAAVLSRFQPVSALKGGKLIGGRSRLTRTIVILQYTASIALMICTGVMFEQQHYVRNKNLGYDRDQVVVVYAKNKKLADRFKHEILKDPRVLNATIADRAFTSGWNKTGLKLPDGTRFSVRVLGVDPDYLSTLRIPLLAGRNFSEAHPSDREQAVLINESLAQKLKMDNPIGRLLPGFDWNGLNPIVIGIIDDFHIDSLHKSIQPLVLQMKQFNSGPYLLIRIRPEDVLGTLAFLKTIWQDEDPNGLLSHWFLDTALDRQYRDEQRWERVLIYSALFAITISCLGLLGLASLAVARRTKEVGIRKVLGASVGHLVGLLSRDFVKLLVAANVIAWPVAYWAMDKWLTNFAYRIELKVDVFILAGMLAICIALLAVVLQTLKAARRNPIDVLRYE